MRVIYFDESFITKLLLIILIYFLKILLASNHLYTTKLIVIYLLFNIEIVTI